MTKKSTDLVNPMESALTVFAGEFTDFQQKVDQDGEVTIYNGMAYIQRRMLNGICYTAEKLIEEQYETLGTAGKKLARLVRSQDGGEIGTKQIEDQTRWVQRLQLQVSVLTNCFEQAKAVHLKQLGEAYVPYRQRTKPDAAKAAINGEQSETMRNALAILETLGANAPDPTTLRIH